MTQSVEDVAYKSVTVGNVTAFLVPDGDQLTNPLTDQDNVGTLYSWTRGFDGDERIAVPDLILDCEVCGGTGEVEVTVAQFDDQPGVSPCSVCGGKGYREDVPLQEWFAHYYAAVLVIPLWFDDYGSRGARLYESDDPNCALVFTQAELDREWSGHLDSHLVEMKYAVSGEPTGEVREYGGARQYAEGRVEELDHWLRGNVWGIVAKDEDGDVLESVWGFIGDPDSDWIMGELREFAEDAAVEAEREREERDSWAARGMVTR